MKCPDCKGTGMYDDPLAVDMLDAVVGQCPRCQGAGETSRPIPTAKNLSAEVVRDLHRGTVFRLQFDISALIGPDGTAMERDEFLEEILMHWCEEAIKGTLARARAKIPNHP